MNRKATTWFIYLMGLGLAIALSLIPQVSLPKTISSLSEIRGVWITNVGSGVLYSPWGINRAIHQLSQLNFNTIYPVAWNRGNTFYISSIAKEVVGSSQDPFINTIRLGGDVLTEIVKEGKRQNLRVIPWFEYGFMAPATSEIARRHPDWLTLRRNGSTRLKLALEEEIIPKKAIKPSKKQLVSSQVWLNPLHPEVQRFLLSLIVEVVSKYDVDGIQLDDHFGLPVDFGYDPFTVKLYQKEHKGKRPPVNSKDPEWMQWRAAKLTALMGDVFKAVKVIKPNCKVTLSPNGQDFAYRNYLQDWQTWVKKGWVEELILQVYRQDTKKFLAELSQSAIQTARHQIPVGVGLMTGSLRYPVSSAKIQKQVQLIRDRGFQGVSFFYWESLWGYIAPESPRERRAAFHRLFNK